MSGTLFVVATPIGNLEDISARALRVLREASVIAAEDTRRTAHLLARYAIATPTTSLHEHNETRKTARLVERLLQGERIALVSDAGTPTVSDPGQRLIRAAVEAGVRVESIPGPSAVFAALAASGFPADHFSFHGFPPTRSKDRIAWFERVRTGGGTVVFFEAPHRILQTLSDLQAAIGDRPVAVGRELTKAHEAWVRGPISSVSSRLQTVRGEFTVVADLGDTTESPGVADSSGLTDPAAIRAELGRLIESSGLTRRKAAAELAKRLKLRPNEVYALAKDPP